MDSRNPGSGKRPAQAPPEALFERVCALLEAGDSRATQMLPELQRHPEQASGWTMLGQTLARLGQTEAAHSAYEQALASPRAPLAAALGKADLLLAAAGAEAARDWLENAARRWPRQPSLAYRLGRAHYRLGALAPALAAFRDALALAPDFAEAWFQVGLIEQDRDASHAAAHAYRQALALQPGMHEAALNLGMSLQEDGDVEAALDAYALALQAEPGCFNRIALALTSAPVGRLWLSPGALRATLAARA